MNRIASWAFACLAVAGCTSENAGFTKQEVRDIGETEVDYCEEFGWYGDGECDSFCLDADPDCGGCIRTGCSGELCNDEPLTSTCEARPEYACYDTHGACERQADGLCGWTETPELSACLDDPSPEPGECRRTGCSGQICADEDIATTCEVLPGDACYADHGICGRQDDGECGWMETAELEACLADPEPDPEPDPGECRRTGCSGEICAADDLATTCEVRPEFVCYQRYGVCGGGEDGCGWEDTPQLRECLAEFGL